MLNSQESDPTGALTMGSGDPIHHCRNDPGWRTDACWHKRVIITTLYYCIIIIIIILHKSKINHFQTTSHITFPPHEIKSKANNKTGIVMQNNTRRCLQVGSQCCLTWNRVRSVTLRLMKRFITYSKHGNHQWHLYAKCDWVPHFLSLRFTEKKKIKLLANCFFKKERHVTNKHKTHTFHSYNRLLNLSYSFDEWGWVIPSHLYHTAFYCYKFKAEFRTNPSV